MRTTWPIAANPGQACCFRSQPRSVQTMLVRVSIRPCSPPTVLEGRKLAKQRLLGLAEQRHVGAVLATAQHGAQCDHQDLMQVVTNVVLPWIGDRGKAGDKFFPWTAPEMNPILGIRPPPTPQRLLSAQTTHMRFPCTGAEAVGTPRLGSSRRSLNRPNRVTTRRAF